MGSEKYRYLPPDGLQMSVQQTETLCQRDAYHRDEDVHEVPRERSRSFGHRGKGCACVRVAE